MGTRWTYFSRRLVGNSPSSDLSKLLPVITGRSLERSFSPIKRTVLTRREEIQQGCRKNQSNVSVCKVTDPLLAAGAGVPVGEDKALVVGVGERSAAGVGGVGPHPVSTTRARRVPTRMSDR